MIRFFLFFFIFFILWIEVFHNLFLLDLWKLNFGGDSQRRIFKIMQNIATENRKSIFVFGGSATRELFVTDKNISKKLKIPFYNCAVSNETPFDSLKLQTLVKSNNTIVYGMHIKSFADASFNLSQVTKGYYFGGAYYKYPAHISKELIVDLISQDNNISSIYSLFPVINAYVSTFKVNINSLYGNKDNLFIDKIPKQYHYIGKQSLLKIDVDEKMKKYLKKSKDTMMENMSLNFKIIEAMIKLSIKHNTKFILIELPFSNIIHQYFKNYLPIFYNKINKLIKKYPNIKFISNKNFSKYKKGLFYDSMHLMPKGRKYFYQDSIKILEEAVK